MPRFGTIVVPLDGSAASGHALPVAARLARSWEAPIELVRVRPPPPRYGAAPVIDRMFDSDVAKSAVASLRATAHRLASEHGIAVTVHELAGQPAAAIAAHVDERRDALIVMSSHGRGGLSRAWLGSVTDAVIRHSLSPVLVVPGRESDADNDAPAPPFRRILVPLDGSRFARRVIDVACAFVSAPDTELHFVRILEPLPMMEPFPGLAAVIERKRAAEAVAEQRQRAQADLERVGRSLGRLPGTVRTHVELSPRAAAVLLAYVRANDIDLVSIATHGRGGLARATLGSVADKVVRGAGIPVVVFRPAARRQRQRSGARQRAAS
ncbi:MAG: universal stress protein [Gemmatimonadota bacterium]|nr:universal stress protein [Gemmatimonadota bacterium]